MIVAQSLVAGYDHLMVLKSVSLHVEPQEVVAIIGSNGAGKSTLLLSLMGIVSPLAGRIVFEGEELQKLPVEKRVELGCVLVPEGRRVFSTMTVRENLEMGAYSRLHSGRRLEVKESLNWIFSLFPILAQRQMQLAGTLSGGEQQMLAIGRALMTRPKLLMLDEPSLGVAPLVVSAIFKTIKNLQASGLAILIVEQNARRVLQIADRGYVIETGRFILEGTSQELLANSDVERSYLGKDYRAINE